MISTRGAKAWKIIKKNDEVSRVRKRRLIRD